MTLSSKTGALRRPGGPRRESGQLRRRPRAGAAGRGTELSHTSSSLPAPSQPVTGEPSGLSILVMDWKAPSSRDAKRPHEGPLGVRHEPQVPLTARATTGRGVLNTQRSWKGLARGDREGQPAPPEAEPEGQAAHATASGAGRGGPHSLLVWVVWAKLSLPPAPQARAGKTPQDPGLGCCALVN